MKRRILTLILAWMTILSMAACQAASEEPFVAKNDAERLIEQAGAHAGGTELNSIGILQGQYTCDLTGANGKLNIHVDAKIITPDTKTLPIMRASVGTFGQEQITSIFRYLFANEKPVSNEQVETKADIEAEIARMKEQLAEGDHAGFTSKQYEDVIAQLEEACKNAPETVPEAQTSDGTMRLIFDPQTQAPLFWVLSVASQTARMSASKPADVSRMGVQETGAYIGGATLTYERLGIHYSTRNQRPTDGETMPDGAKDKLTISYADAKAVCEAFFAAAGCPNTFQVGSAFIIDDTGADEAQGSNYAYKLCYTRSANGIPLFFAPSGGIYNTDQAFSLPWNYETIEFIVDNDGISRLDWDNPVVIGETVEANATLKAFDEISDVFKTMMKTCYEDVMQTRFAGSGELAIHVNDVRLCLMRIREQNATQTDGLLIPAWVFYGHNKATGSDQSVYYLQGASVIAASDPSNVSAEVGAELNALSVLPSARASEPVVLLVVNAIDGSVIDVSKGY